MEEMISITFKLMIQVTPDNMVQFYFVFFTHSYAQFG
jgi:hypothetical protein